MSMGAAAEAGAWGGNVRREAFGTTAPACLGPLSWLTLPTSSIALSSRKDTVAETQEGKKRRKKEKEKSVALKGNKEWKLAKMDGKRVG
jgi:hypothetical protein